MLRHLQQSIQGKKTCVPVDHHKHITKYLLNCPWGFNILSPVNSKIIHEFPKIKIPFVFTTEILHASNQKMSNNTLMKNGSRY